MVTPEHSGSRSRAARTTRGVPLISSSAFSFPMRLLCPPARTNPEHAAFCGRDIRRAGGCLLRGRSGREHHGEAGAAAGAERALPGDPSTKFGQPPFHVGESLPLRTGLGAEAAAHDLGKVSGWDAGAFVGNLDDDLAGA